MSLGLACALQGRDCALALCTTAGFCISRISSGCDAATVAVSSLGGLRLCRLLILVLAQPYSPRAAWYGSVPSSAAAGAALAKGRGRGYR